MDARGRVPALLGLAIGDLYLAGLGLVGGATATITSLAAGFKEEAYDTGLMGYNASGGVRLLAVPRCESARRAGGHGRGASARRRWPPRLAAAGKAPDARFNAVTLSALLYTRPSPTRRRAQLRPSTRT